MTPVYLKLLGLVLFISSLGLCLPALKLGDRFAEARNLRSELAYLLAAGIVLLVAQVLCFLALALGGWMK